MALLLFVRLYYTSVQIIDITTQEATVWIPTVVKTAYTTDKASAILCKKWSFTQAVPQKSSADRT
jgi:hypothetical protein